MKVDDDTSPGFRLAAMALDRVAAEGLEPFPANFTLWYSYYSGSLPDLTRVIDRKEAEGKPFTQVRCDELFQQFFSSDTEARAIREAGERTQAALNRLLEILQSASVGSGQYADTLGDFRSELEGPLTADRLRAAISAIVTETRTIADQHERLLRRLSETGSELAQLRARLFSARRELMIDSLTGISNRKGFDHSLSEAAAAALAEGQPLSLLMIDIDHFKTFNDQHGHLVGDHVLRLVAKVLTDGVKGRDTVARFGGEEFTVILPRTTLTDATALADSLRVTVGRCQIVNRSRNENFGTITLSIGAAEYVPRESLNDLMSRADTALYVAKRTGRNRVCLQVAPAPESVVD